MYQQPIPQFRLEPRRLGRHDSPSVRDRHQIVNRHGIHRKRDGGPTRIDRALEAFGPASAADEIHAFVGSDIPDAEHPFQHVALQERDIETVRA